MIALSIIYHIERARMYFVLRNQLSPGVFEKFLLSASVGLNLSCFSGFDCFNYILLSRPNHRSVLVSSLWRPNQLMFLW